MPATSEFRGERGRGRRFLVRAGRRESMRSELGNAAEGSTRPPSSRRPKIEVSFNLTWRRSASSIAKLLGKAISRCQDTAEQLLRRSRSRPSGSCGPQFQRHPRRRDAFALESARRARRRPWCPRLIFLDLLAHARAVSRAPEVAPPRHTGSVSCALAWTRTGLRRGSTSACLLGHCLDPTQPSRTSPARADVYRIHPWRDIGA